MTIRLISLLSLVLVLLGACSPGKTPTCDFSPTGFDYTGDSAAIIPLNSGNFWIYTDSSRDASGNAIANPDFLLTTRNSYVVNGSPSVAFNQFLPQLTLSGDTLYATEQTPPQPPCYRLVKYLFKVSDTTMLELENRLYPDPAACTTPAGSFAGNIVYQSGPATDYRMTVHPGIGIIKVEMGNRVLSLKSYTLR